MTTPFSGAEPIDLSKDEIALLRFTCDLVVDDESALGADTAKPDPEALQRSAESLVAKGLADRKTYRPHRELVRRLLVAAQPDARVILLAAGPGLGERLLDVYVRAGAFVRHDRSGNGHRLGPPLEYIDVFDEIMSHFTARSSSGDFIDLRLTTDEYFAFSTAAMELANKKSKGHESVDLDDKPPGPSWRDRTMDGAAVIPGRSARLGPQSEPPRFSIPTPAQWETALRGLEEKGAINRADGRYRLRGYLHDLAVGLASRSRYVLTRFDFGSEDWFVRDATLVPVSGSLFWIRTQHDGGLRIREVDRDTLKLAVRSAIEEIHAGKTGDY